MEIRFAKASDIDRFMDLVRLVKDDFPGLETEESLKEHRDTVLRFIENRSAICALEDGGTAGVLLFSAEDGELCFLAVHPLFRRRHIAEKMFSLMISQMDVDKDIKITTFREGDPKGISARAFYKKLGFSEGELFVEFGYPAQKLILKRK